MKLISVIMSVYNTSDEAILNSAIDSILNQTYKNFEFIICDDGSTDNTFEIINTIVDGDSRVKLLKNQTNLGLASSLNKCIKISKGEYIARMDADDISHIDRLEKQLEFLEKNKEYDFCGTNVYLIKNDIIWGKRVTKEVPEKKDFLFGTQFVHPTLMIKKNALEKVNNYTVTKETRRAEDYDLFMKLYAVDKIGYNIQSFLLKYREDNLTYRRRKLKFRIDELKVRYHGFKKMGILNRNFIYIFKPIAVGLLPQKLLAILRRENI